MTARAPSGSVVGLTPRRSKYGAELCYSALCGRRFASKAERERGEELRLLEMAGEIGHLEYQPRWVLSVDPPVSVKADFRYLGLGAEIIVEDVKGVVTRDSRLRLAWLRQRFGIRVRLLRKTPLGWEEIKL